MNPCPFEIRPYACAKTRASTMSEEKDVALEKIAELQSGLDEAVQELSDGTYLGLCNLSKAAYEAIAAVPANEPPGDEPPGVEEYEGWAEEAIEIMRRISERLTQRRRARNPNPNPNL